MTNKKRPTLLKRKEGLYLKNTDDKGRGVFCRTNIKKGEILEVTPALILNEKSTSKIAGTILMNYVFSIGNLSKKLLAKKKIKKRDDASCVVMGVGSYCNHSDTPNAQIIWEQVDNSVYYSLQATRAIPKHTEICTSYGDSWFEERDKKKAG